MNALRLSAPEKSADELGVPVVPTPTAPTATRLRKTSACWNSTPTSKEAHGELTYEYKGFKRMMRRASRHPRRRRKTEDVLVMSNKEKRQRHAMLDQKKIPHTRPAKSMKGYRSTPSPSRKTGIRSNRSKNAGDKGRFGRLFCILVPAAPRSISKSARRRIKIIAMIKVSELLPLTGYIRGGCSQSA